MTELERDLRTVLTERAADIRMPPEVRDEALRRARRRRMVTVAGVAAVFVALAATSTIAVQATLFDAAPVRPAHQDRAHETDGPYGFSSRPGRYPVIATGTFRDARWTLEGVEERIGPGVHSMRMILTIDGNGAEFRSELRVDATDDVLLVEHVEPGPALDGEAGVVFGAAIKGLDSIVVDVAAPGDSIPTHRFDRYSPRSDINADYVIAFVPVGEKGFVAARDELGVDLDLEPLGGIDVAPGIISSGEADGVGWTVGFVGRRNRACVVFDAGVRETHCWSRAEVERRPPLLMKVFEGPELKGIVAVLSDEVWDVRVRPRGGDPVVMAWAQPPNDELRRWPLRLVSVGLPSGSRGVLEALEGRRVVDRQMF